MKITGVNLYPKNYTINWYNNRRGKRTDFAQAKYHSSQIDQCRRKFVREIMFLSTSVRLKIF